MKKTTLLGSAAVAVTFGALAFSLIGGYETPAMAQETPQTAVPTASAVERKQVETIIREYLLANPELLLEVQQALDVKQKEEQRVAALAVIDGARDDIFNSEFDGVVGNPKGDVTIV